MSIFFLIFNGCSKSEYAVAPADEKKSCSAFLYEYNELKMRELRIEDENRSKRGYLHHAVVGTGIVASLNPYTLSGSYFFLFPALTIWYYNIFFDDGQKIENEQRFKKRLEILEMFLEKKRCSKGS